MITIPVPYRDVASIRHGVRKGKELSGESEGARAKGKVRRARAKGQGRRGKS